MGKNLVIVESPAKAKTIENYLGSDYTVLSSVGQLDRAVLELMWRTTLSRIIKM